jgi:peptide chain release factor subunit 1
MSERRAADLKKAGVQAGHELTKEERHIQMWKMKKLIKSLTNARGNGTSMISLILPPNTQISLTTKMLNDEIGTATNIKSRVNRLSVLGAITSALQILKHYTRTPANGLIVYSGLVTTDEGKEKRVRIDFEPFKAVNTSLYLCDNKFHTEALGELLQDDDQFGFIVMDGNGCLFGTVTGSSRNVLHKFSVDLPKKHGRGGQSALRFARLRLEKRHNYVRKVAETATQLYVPDGAVPSVRGIVLAGSADFKDELMKSDLFDARLKKIVIKMVDVSYGGENGFAQAIELSQDALANVKFVQEKKLISRYFEEIAQDTGKYCFGVKDTFIGLEMGAIKTLILYENLDTMRVTLKNNTTGDEEVKHFTPAQMQDDANFIDKETGVELETIDSIELIEWLAENFKQFGCEMQFITDRSQEGSQFCQGFGGIGGILRWAVDFGQLSEYIEQDAKDWDEDDSSSDDDGAGGDYYDPDADFGF